MPTTQKAPLCGVNGGPPFFQEFRNAPRRHDEQPDQGDISVAVSHGLTADLHNPYDGHKRACKPEPSHSQAGKPLCRPDNRNGDCDKEQNRPQDLPERHNPG